MALITSEVVGMVFAVLLSISSPAQELTNTPKQSSAPKSWEIEITSSGGFHGQGDGGITINSNGTATVSDLTRSCTLQVPPESVQELDSALTTWGASLQNQLHRDLERGSAEWTIDNISVNLSCCDLIKYSMNIKYSEGDLGERKYSESWFLKLDRTASPSLSTVRRGSLQLRDSLLAQCQQ